MSDWIDMKRVGDETRIVIDQDNRQLFIDAKKRFVKFVICVVIWVVAMLLERSISENIKFLVGFLVLFPAAIGGVYFAVTSLLTFATAVYTARTMVSQVEIAIRGRRFAFVRGPRVGSLPEMELADMGFRVSDEVRKFRAYNRAEWGVIGSCRGTSFLVAEGLDKGQAEYLKAKLTEAIG